MNPSLPSNMARPTILPVRFCRLGAIFLLFSLPGLSPLFAHPGSGIVVADDGSIYFVDTGAGVWRIPRQGGVVRHEGSPWHWMTIDRHSRFTAAQPPKLAGGDLEVTPGEPRLIISSDFPIVVAPDGALYFPEVNQNGQVQIMRLPPRGSKKAFATLPVAHEIDPSGKTIEAKWIHGLAAGPNGSLYYAERQAMRQIAPDGKITLLAGSIKVPDCQHPPAITGDRVDPALRGLDVTPSGTVYVAASACSALLKITNRGEVSVALRAEDPWSPMGVAVHGDELYVLEYCYIPTDRREDWIPRVRKVLADGKVTVIATVERE